MNAAIALVLALPIAVAMFWACWWDAKWAAAEERAWEEHLAYIRRGDNIG